MKNIYRVLVLMITLYSAGANSTAYQGYVKNVFALDEKIYVYIKEGGSVDYCDNSEEYFITWIDLSTEYGKSMFSIALAAKATDKLVWVRGNNNCTSAASGKQAERLISIDLKG